MMRFRLAEKQETVILDEDTTEEKARIGRDKKRVTRPGLCAGLRVGRPRHQFLLLI